MNVRLYQKMYFKRNIIDLIKPALIELLAFRGKNCGIWQHVSRISWDPHWRHSGRSSGRPGSVYRSGVRSSSRVCNISRSSRKRLITLYTIIFFLPLLAGTTTCLNKNEIKRFYSLITRMRNKKRQIRVFIYLLRHFELETFQHYKTKNVIHS